MKEFLSVLLECPLFDGIEEENLQVMLGCLGARTASFGKREAVMSEGDPVRYVGILLQGEAQIVQVDYFGNRSIVSVLEPGELFGETFACAGVERMPVDVVATEDVQVMLIDCRRIMQSCCNACAFHQQMIYNLMKVVATKSLHFHRKIEIAACRTTRDKLLTYLAQQAKRRGSRTFEIPYDRQELADYLGVDRSGLSVEIGKLRREGVLNCEKNRFELL